MNKRGVSIGMRCGVEGDKGKGRGEERKGGEKGREGGSQDTINRTYFLSV